MPVEECKRFEYCNAAICPLEPNISKMIWYPNEDVCSRTDIRPNWVKIQLRIKSKKCNPDFYFTVEMLKVIDKVSKKLKGCDPDYEGDYSKLEKNWIKNYLRQREKARQLYLQSDLYKQHQKKLLEAV